MKINNEKQLIALALKSYDNPQCISVQEFNSDLDRLSYLKRIFNRYRRNGEIEPHTVRLAINHVVVLFNCFGMIALDFIIFRLTPEYLEYLIPILTFLNRLPDELIEKYSDVDLNQELIEILSEL